MTVVGDARHLPSAPNHTTCSSFDTRGRGEPSADDVFASELFQAPGQQQFAPPDPFDCPTAANDEGDAFNRSSAAGCHEGTCDDGGTCAFLQSTLSYAIEKKAEAALAVFESVAAAHVPSLLDFADDIMLTPSIAQLDQLHELMSMVSDKAESPAQTLDVSDGGSRVEGTGRAVDARQESGQPGAAALLAAGPMHLAEAQERQFAHPTLHFSASAQSPCAWSSPAAGPRAHGQGFDAPFLATMSDDTSPGDLAGDRARKCALTISCPFAGCAKRFAKCSNLRAHVRLHTGEKPYACSHPGCPKRFMWMSALKPHERMHKKRATLSSYRTPEEIEAEKVHHCSYCERRFARKTSLTNHERSHLNVRRRRSHAPGRTAGNQKASAPGATVTGPRHSTLGHEGGAP